MDDKQFWKEKVVKVKDAGVGKTIDVVFHSTKALEIKELKSSCGCSVPKYFPEKKELVVKYTPQAIPKHLKLQGWYEARKVIAVRYSDGSLDSLTFVGKIIADGPIV